jgi:hypothetical protein
MRTTEIYSLMMDKISTALKGYLSKAKDQLTQAKQSFFNTPTPPTKDNPPPETGMICFSRGDLTIN